MIIGAKYSNPAAVISAGRSYVVFGKTGTTAINNLSAIAAGNGGFVINGQYLIDYSGVSVASSGDAAVRLARDCAALRGGRALLRERMAASPLCDIQSYVGYFEALLRRMWVAYCEGDKQRVIMNN